MSVNLSGRSNGRYVLKHEDKIDQIALKQFREEKVKQGVGEVKKILKENEANLAKGDISKAEIETQFFRQWKPVLDKDMNAMFRQNNPYLVVNRDGIKVGIFHLIRKNV